MNDTELLRAWAAHRDESAFAELVRRHLNLVYAAARRQSGGLALSQEITQAVFLVLARKAGSLAGRVTLSGWLFRTTCFVAARAVRTEQRRLRHEALAVMQMNTSKTSELPEIWREVESHLDAALAALSASDRDALLLRFFQGQSLRAVGEQLGISEEAAKKRVSRALEKLRSWLGRRGILLTSTGLLTMLTQFREEAAPAGWVGQISAHASANTAGAATSALASGAIRDWFFFRLSQSLPPAVASLIVITLGLWWALSPNPPALNQLADGGPAAPAAGKPNPSLEFPATKAISAVQPGPSRILLSVHSARDRRPLLARLLVTSLNTTLELTTDEHGMAEIPVTDSRVRSLTLWVSAPGHVPVRLPWTRHEFVEPLLVQQCWLEPGQILQGQVQDEVGQPVSGAQIAFTGPDIDGSKRENVAFHSRLSSVTSDAQGYFRSDQIPLLAGSHSTMAYAVSHPDFTRAVVSLEGQASLATNHVVVLRRGFQVAGQVVGPDDLPVAHALVEEIRTVYGQTSHEVETADDGRFFLGTYPAGPVQLAITAEGFKSTTETVSAGPSTNQTVIRLAWEDGSKSEWEQAMDSAPTMRMVGTVVDADSEEPVSQFRIALDDPDGSQPQWIGRGHDGRFDWAVHLPFRQQFLLEVDAEGYEPAASEIRPVQEDTQHFEFRLRRGGLTSGRVVDLHQRPVAGAIVLCHGLDFGVDLRGKQVSAPSGVPQTLTDAEGRFSLRMKRNTESLLAVHESGFAQVPMAHARPVTIPLQPWGAIEGVVVAGGQVAPEQGVILQAWVPEAGSEPLGVSLNAVAVSDAEGRFRFDVVPPGPVAVGRRFTIPGALVPIRVGPRQRVDVPAGGVAEIVLGTSGRTLVGRLALTQPSPDYRWQEDPQVLEAVQPELPALTLANPGEPDYLNQLRAASYRGSRIRRFFLDVQPDGSFRVSDVPAGDYRLQLHVSLPPKDRDDSASPIGRRQRGQLIVPVIVPEGDDQANEVPLDLGTFSIPVR